MNEEERSNIGVVMQGKNKTTFLINNNFTIHTWQPP